MFGDVLKPLHLDLINLGVVSAHVEQANHGTLGSSHLLKVDESAATFGHAALCDLPVLCTLTPQAGQHLLFGFPIFTINMGDMEYRRRKKGKVSRLRKEGRLDVKERVGKGFFCCDAT